MFDGKVPDTGGVILGHDKGGIYRNSEHCYQGNDIESAITFLMIS